MAIKMKSFAYKIGQWMSQNKRSPIFFPQDWGERQDKRRSGKAKAHSVQGGFKAARKRTEKKGEGLESCI